MLTPNIDIRNVNTPGAIFGALPVVQSSGFLNNTLNAGDDLNDTAGDGTLNYITANNGFAANPPFAFGVTLNGISTLNISNFAPHTVAGFQGDVTGLTTVNDTNSIYTVRLGGFNQGLNTALTNVNIAHYGGANGTYVFKGIISTDAAAATNTINIGISNRLGGTGAGLADKLLFTSDGGPGTADSPNLSYGTWAITTNTANVNEDLELQQGGVGGATTLVLAGKSNIAVGQDAAGNWQNLTTIDASGESGNVVITGASSGFTHNAFATAANPGWLFGSAAGLLDDTGATFNLTSFRLGTGANILDVSSASADQVAALTTSGVAGPKNEIIVNDAVATTTSTATFAHINGFEILGVTGAGGTIDMANLPGSINEILYQTPATGDVSIIDQVNPLTVNVEDNGRFFALSSAGAGFTDSFTLDLGNSLHNTASIVGHGAGHVGPLTLTADSIVNINALGQTTTGPAITDTVGFVSLTPAIAGNEVVTFENAPVGVLNASLVVGDATGAVGDFNPISGALNPFNLSLIDDSHASVTLLGGTGGVLQGYSTNAFSIDAHAATGALVMQGGDANFNPGATVLLSIGDTITGAAATGNILIGSLGNDVIASKGSGDVIATDGGADTISLNGGGDTIDVFAAAGAVPSHISALGGVAGAGNIVNAGDVASAGWWGLGAGAGPVALSTLATATGFGVSTDLSIVHGAANAVGGTSDVVGFSTGAWSGLLTDTFGNGLSGAPATVFTNPVAPGGTITNAADVIEIGVGTYLGAATLANSIAGLGLTTPFAQGAVNTDYHFIVAYQNSANGGGVTLADMDVVVQAAGVGSHVINGTNDHIAISDMVQLTGVNIAQLTAANIHFQA
jgi:hypothetical protein